jgi:hypothetical protein
MCGSVPPLPTIRSVKKAQGQLYFTLLYFTLLYFTLLYFKSMKRTVVVPFPKFNSLSNLLVNVSVTSFHSVPEVVELESVK